MEENKPICIVFDWMKWRSEIQDISIGNYWEDCIWLLEVFFGTVNMRDDATTGISFTKQSGERKKTRRKRRTLVQRLILSFINNDMTWNSRKTSLIVKFLWKEKLSDIKSSHNGSSKEIKSINNLWQQKAKSSEQLRKENYLQSRFARPKEKKGDFFAQLNIIQFFVFIFSFSSPSSSSAASIVLRKRISFHDSLKRGIKKIKYLSFCECKFHGEAAAESYNISL